MNIKKTAKAFAIAAVVGMSSQVFAATTNAWWNMDFQDATTITALTNTSYSAVGQWSTAAGDESSIQTNIYDRESIVLKLDTQGNNVTWTPTAASTTEVVLVDAKIYLVGSDSEPTGFDEDAGNPVQTAVYLKNYINSENVTTSSVLCAYVENEINANVWVELEGVELVDTNWYDIRILVDYTDIKPMAKFIVNNTVMNAAGVAEDDLFPVANNSSFDGEGEGFVNSVSFRGTGAVDNFVGSQVIPDQALQLTFTVSTFTDNVSNAMDNVLTGGDATVSAGTPWNVVLGYYDEEPAGVTNYLTVVRVYTNSTQFVDYSVSFDGSVWTLTGTPFVDDPENGGISYTITTGDLTMGYIVQGYYGDAPAGGNPDPDTENPPAIGGETAAPATAFETINAEEYFSVSFLAPQAGIEYTLQTCATVDGTFADETDPLASDVSETADQEMTLSAPTDGATTQFYRIKASTVQ